MAKVRLFVLAKVRAHIECAPTNRPLCRGRTCAARGLPANALLWETSGPGMPGPYTTPMPFRAQMSVKLLQTHFTTLLH